jgi:hypothetical protein
MQALEHLNELREKDMITTEEYEEHRRTVLHNLVLRGSNKASASRRKDSENGGDEPAESGQRRKQKHAKGAKRGKRVESGGEMDVDMAAEDEAEEDGGKGEGGKGEASLRTLTPISEWGLGNNDSGDRISAFARARTVWHKRGNRESYTGPFNDSSALNWMVDRRKQLRFAQLFATPLCDQAELRSISGDVVPVNMQPDYSKLMLCALMSVEKATWMEIPRTRLVQDVLLLQHKQDRKRDLVLDGGPEGGLQGLASCVFWQLECSDDLRSFNRELLDLAEVHACAHAVASF